jgi:hypothetical protein
MGSKRSARRESMCGTRRIRWVVLPTDEDDDDVLRALRAFVGIVWPLGVPTDRLRLNICVRPTEALEAGAADAEDKMPLTEDVTGLLRWSEE